MQLPRGRAPNLSVTVEGKASNPGFREAICYVPDVSDYRHVYEDK